MKKVSTTGSQKGGKKIKSQKQIFGHCSSWHLLSVFHLWKCNILLLLEKIINDNATKKLFFAAFRKEAIIALQNNNTCLH